MFDFFTYFVYISLLAIMVYLTGYGHNLAKSDLNTQLVPKLRIQHYLALLIMSFIVGFRFKVGVDWEGYKEYFEHIASDPNLQFTDQTFELGYFYLNKIISATGLSYEWMFFTVAFISWYFFFKSISQNLLPILILFIFLDEFFFWGMNGVRQFMAISIWVYSIQYIINKKFLNYILLIILASMFHVSVIILLPLYFIPYIKINKKGLWLSLYLISLILGTTNFFISFVESIINFMGSKIAIIGLYLYYIETNMLVVDNEILTGFGFIFKITLNLLILILSNKVTKAYPNTTIYFILFFIGSILFNLSYNIQLIGRINNYFLILRSVVLAIMFWHFWKFSKNRAVLVLFVSLYFLLFLSAIYNSSNLCSPYITNLISN